MTRKTKLVANAIPAVWKYFTNKTLKNALAKTPIREDQISILFNWKAEINLIPRIPKTSKGKPNVYIENIVATSIVSVDWKAPRSNKIATIHWLLMIKIQTNKMEIIPIVSAIFFTWFFN